MFKRHTMTLEGSSHCVRDEEVVMGLLLGGLDLGMLGVAYIAELGLTVLARRCESGVPTEA